ncbi:contactin-associated protein-like 2 [Branchiostoma lanceolatum]|uniref:contactin-associated protein-like 2 n=1 Tax=Branchiostoma lanceolatum TaxID=7740 RepID=UPI003453D5EB
MRNTLQVRRGSEGKVSVFFCGFRRFFSAATMQGAVWLMLAGLTAVANTQNVDPECNFPLGMSSRLITDGQISSTSFVNYTTAPRYARLNRREGGGGWSASKDDFSQYLTFDLMDRSRITAISTQGRYNSNEWVKEYRIQFSDNRWQWRTYGQTLKGNTNADGVVTNTLTGTWIGRYMRINPRSWNTKISMRVEIYGCLDRAHSATFAGDGYLRYEISREEDRVATYQDTIKMRFKTNQPHGMLLYGHGSQNDFISLELIWGKIWLRVNLGTSTSVDGYTEATAGSLLDDDQWHSIEITRKRRDISLKVDRFFVKFRTNGDFERMDLDRQITVGGVDFLFPGVIVRYNFQGCLQNVFFNGINMIERTQRRVDAFSSVGSVTYSCQGTTQSSLTIPSPESYLRLPGASGRNTIALGFEFRTFNRESMMAYTQINEGTGSIMVRLADGRLNVTIVRMVNNVERVVPILSDEYQNDGRWHSVVVNATENSVIVTYDYNRTINTNTVLQLSTGDKYYLGEPNTHVNLQQSLNQLSTGDKYYLGGCPPSAVSQEGCPIRGELKPFQGCMRRIVIDGQNVDLQRLADGRLANSVKTGVQFNYCGIVDRCTPNPCEHGATCEQDWYTFTCNCQPTGYNGATCHLTKYEDSCGNYNPFGEGVARGTKFIDPDGSGPLAPFPVQCATIDLHTVETVITHDSMARTAVSGFAGAGSYKKDINYQGSLAQVLPLMMRSERCRQRIRYECTNSRLLNSPNGQPFGWWVGRTNDKMVYWGDAGPGTQKCACGLDGSCRDPAKYCNCDGIAGFETVRGVDEGYLTQMPYLPVIQLRFGDTSPGSGFHTLGPLECFGDIMFNNSATFKAAEAHLRFPTFQAKRSGDICFQFITRAGRGVFVHNRGARDFFKVEMLSPRQVSLSYDVGNGRQEVVKQMTYDLNDNRFHSICAERNLKEARIVVDKQRFQDPALAEETIPEVMDAHESLNLNSQLFVGSDTEGRNGFIGVMRDLSVNGVHQDLYSAAIPAWGVEPGMVRLCEPVNPCQNNATCIEGWGFYECNCTLTPHEGPTCSNGETTPPASKAGASTSATVRSRHTRGRRVQMVSHLLSNTDIFNLRTSLKNLCQNYATCIEGWGFYECNCTLTPHEGPTCSNEIGARMESSSYLEYTFPSEFRDSVKDNITVGFITEHKQGILMHVVSETGNYMTLRIKDSGGIQLRFDLGDGRDEELNNDLHDYADDQYHTVNITRVGKRVSMLVDGYLLNQRTFDISNDRFKGLSNGGKLFVGRIQRGGSGDTPSNKGFKGCISRVMFNDVFPLKFYFLKKQNIEFQRGGTVRAVPDDSLLRSSCGIEPVIMPPRTVEPWPTAQADIYQTTLADGMLTTEAAIVPDVVGARESNSSDAAVIGGVVAVLIFVLLVLLCMLARYAFRHKGSYNTNEAKGADQADDPDTAVVAGDPRHTGSDVGKKKEWFI